MKQNELKLGVKKLKGVKKRFVMELTPEQSLQLKMIALTNNTTVKSMILKAFQVKE
jgi:hypothetical protein